jgi:indolepyruvate ferredoxin oxidoreductase, beta subunit
MSFNIFLCGVGGQGLVLLTSVIGNACAKSGLKAVTGEMYGLSQRSGSVFVHMRIGNDAYSPLIPVGSADIIVSLEAIEALRYIEFLKKNGTILLNKRIMHPPSETSKLVTDKTAKYVTLDDIVGKLQVWTSNIALVDALRLAKEAGNVNAENTVFLGCLSVLKEFPVDENEIVESIKESVPKKTIEQNLKAFMLGKQEARQGLCAHVECKQEA